jgi:hypothetical protein
MTIWFYLAGMRQKTTLRKIFLYAFAAIAWMGTGMYLFHHAPKQGGLTEEGYGINPSSRKYFEYMRNHDPEALLLPLNWKQATQEYASRLPKKSGDRSANWNQRGPYNIGGRTRAIAIDILDENHLVAGGVTSGVWSSFNGGASWTHGTTAEQIHSLSSIVQDIRPGHENEWYYGTGEEFYGVVSGTDFTSLFSGNGIFKSVDNGQTWQPLVGTQSNTPQTILENGNYDFVWRLAINPANDTLQELYAAVYNGIIRSVDGGTTWQEVLGFGNGPSEFTDIMITPTGTKYATFSDNTTNGGGFYRSEDGINWTTINPVNPEIANLRRTVMACNPQHPEMVYFLGETLNNNQYPLDHFLYKYTYIDGNGTNGTWENRSANLPDAPCQLFTGISFDFGTFRSQFSYDLTIAHHPNAETLIIGGINLHRSNDCFATDNNEWMGGYRCNPAAPWFYVYPNHHPDQHFVLFSRTNPDVLYSTNDGGIYRTDNVMADSVQWNRLNNGIMGSQFYTVGFEEGLSNSDFVMGGMQDNGTWVTDNADINSPWKELHSDDGSYCAMPAGRDFVIVSSQSGRMMKKTIDLQGNLVGTERIDPTTAPSYSFINPLILDPWNQKDVFIAAGKSIWYLPNAQNIPVTGNYPTPAPDSLWVHINASSVPLLAGNISCLDKPLINNDVIYYGTTLGKVFRLDNCYSATPTRVDLSDPSFPSNAYVSSVAVNDLNELEILVSFSNYNKKSLYHSLDGGDTWTEVGGNLEEHPDGTGNGPGVYTVEIYPSNPPIYFAGTSAGLFSTSNLDSTNTIWQMEAAETLGNVIINQIKVRPYDGLVAVGTHGSGVWTTHLDPVQGVGVAEEDWHNEWRIYPTVVSNHLHIESPMDMKSNARIDFFDLSGNKVMSETLNGQKSHWSIPTQHLSRGMYIYVIYYNNKTTTGKIIHE